jgi:hypothetical protein
MRLLIFLGLLLSVASAQDRLILSAEPPPKKILPPKQAACAVQELYVIGWTAHDPAARHKAMLAWLDEAACGADDWVTIWNALPEWAGTSDSPLLRAKIIEKARKTK